MFEDTLESLNYSLYIINSDFSMLNQKFIKKGE